MNAGIPFFITAKLKAELRSKGYSVEQIGRMTPQEAWEANGGIPEPQTLSENLLAALACANRGWLVHPCQPDKKPYTRWKSQATNDPAQIIDWWKRWPDARPGIYCKGSGIFVLDLDVKNGLNGIKEWSHLVETLGSGQNVEVGPMQNTPSGGLHLVLRHPRDLDIPNNVSQLAPGVDIRSEGYFCTGAGYSWAENHGLDTPITDAPGWLLDKIKNLKSKPTQPITTPKTSGNGHFPQESGEYWLQQALARATIGTRNETGFWLACQLRDNRLPQSEASQIMRDYATGVPGTGYGEQEAIASLVSAYAAPARDPARGSGRYVDYANGDLGNKPISSDLPIITPTPGAHKLDDIGNGERLAIRHGHKMRFVKEWGWMVWNGKYWEQDRGQIAKWAKETARSICAEVTACEDEAIAKEIAKHAKSSAMRSKREAMIDAAASEPGVQAAPDDFDQDPWLLNVQNGVLDLKTGELHPHNPRAMMTKIAGTIYDPEATSPTWDSFINRIFNGNQELITCVQRAAGYSLTGDVSEQCSFFLFGIGANGKTTLTGALQDALGNYSMKTRAETLMVKKQDTIPEEVAQLDGVRFMLAAELGEDHQLNESLIKDITGGDKVRARLLYRKSFEFYPQCKPWLYGNHKPQIRGTDRGIWRRLRLIPFMVIIPEPEQDKQLPTKLRGELPGILAWMFRGCMEWQRVGLNTPKDVITATELYRAEQDEIAAFIGECCIENDIVSVTVGELHDAYKRWGGDLSQRRFSKAMAEHGFTTLDKNGKLRRDNYGRTLYQGLGLMDMMNDKDDEAEDDKNV